MTISSFWSRTFILSATLAGLSQSQGALLTINEIDTTLRAAPSAQGYPKAQTLGSSTGLITFSGQSLLLNSLVTGSGATRQQWDVGLGKRPDSVALVRVGTTTPTRNVIWARQNGSATSVHGLVPTTLQAALMQNNLYQGTDNLFANATNAQGNYTNIERADFLYNVSFQATANRAFVVLERGASNAHDPFKVAAITAVDAGGNPTAYGALVSVNNWGTTALDSFTSVVMRTDNSAATPYAQSDITPSTQSLGGVLITMDSLVAVGTPIFGYSLFGGDVISGTHTLTSPSTFPSATTTGTGGLDMVAANVGYLAEVPEPSSLSLLASGLVGMLVISRRGRVV